MLKFFRETKAYTSIFLCLVLLPMVTYAAMIIDASRLQSARVQVQSAGDLAMNAAMSEYDQVLEDMYGLFANAKSPDEIRPAMQTYFEETLSGQFRYSKASDKQYVKEFAEQLTNYAMSGGNDPLQDAEFSNFLQMQLEGKTENYSPFEFKPVTSSSIANANIMKGQIIDYMKYKGPVSVGNNFLNKLGFLKDTEKQSTAVQKKIELTQEISKMADPMQEAFEEIEKYNKKTEEFNPYTDSDGLSVNKATTVMSNTVNALDYMAMNILLYNSIEKLKSWYGDGTDPASCSLWLDLNCTYWDSFYETNESQITDSASAAARLEELISAISQNIVRIDEYGKEVNSGSMGTFESKYGEFTYDIDYNDAGDPFAKNVQFAEQSTTYASDGTPCLANLSSYLNNYTNTMMANFDGYNFNNTYIAGYDWQVEMYDMHMNEAKGIPVTQYITYKHYFQTLKNAYNAIYSKYDTFYKNEHPEESSSEDSAERSKFQATNSILNAINAKLEESLTQSAYDMFIDYLTSTEKYKKQAQYAIDEIKKYKDYYEIVKSLEEFTKNAESALNKIKEQSTVVEKQAGDVKEKAEEIEDDSTKSQIVSDTDTLAKTIDKEDVESLRKVLELYHARFESMKNELEAVEYLGDTVYNFSLDFNNHAGNEKCKIDSPAYFQETIQNFILNNMDRYKGFDKILTTNVFAVYDASTNNVSWATGLAVQEKYQDKAEKIDDNKHTVKDYASNSSAEYDERFYNVLRNSSEAGKSENKPQDTEQQQHLDTVKNYSSVDGEGNPSKTPSVAKTKEENTDAVSTPYAGDQGKFTEIYKDVFGENGDSVNSGYGKAGSASVPSGKDDASSSADSGKDNLSAANNLLGKIATIADEFKNDVYLEEYFTEMFTCQTDKKLDTGKLKLINGYTNDPSKTKFINPNNEWYGQEMEYILWGDPTLGNNLKKTETTIFLIRFAVNAVYAFTAADIQQMSNAIASLIVGWMPVLIPVVQVCITLAVALAESAIDLQMLKNGEDVPIIKDRQTFICSPTGALNKATDLVVDQVANYVTDKVDDAIDNIDTKAKETIADCKADIDSALDSYREQQTESVKTAIYAQLTVPLVSSVTPILSELNEAADNAEAVTRKRIDEAWGNIGNSINAMDGDGITKEFALLAYNNGDGVKEELISTLSEKIKEVGNKTTPENVKEIITKWVDERVDSVSDDLGKKLESVTSKMEKEIMDHADEAATNLKSYMHKEIDSVSKELSGTIKESTKDVIDEVRDSSIDTKSSSIAAKITMNYKEYCKLFMFIGLMDNNNEAKMLNRASVLMQANVLFAVKGGEGGVQKAGTENFHIKEAYTLFYVQADMKMGTLFPWAVKIEENNSGTQASLDFSNLGNNSVTLKYSGIAGY